MLASPGILVRDELGAKLCVERDDRSIIPVLRKQRRKDVGGDAVLRFHLLEFLEEPFEPLVVPRESWEG